MTLDQSRFINFLRENDTLNIDPDYKNAIDELNAEYPAGQVNLNIHKLEYTVQC